MTHFSSRLRVLDLAYISLFAVLITICAWISVPFSVPFTLQTFAVFLALNTLGGRRGFYAIVVYLLMGLTGLPVFSGFQGGIGVLLGVTGGYLAGFLFSGLLYWLLSEKLPPAHFVPALASLSGLFLCYGFGTLWFMSIYSGTGGAAKLLSVLSLCVFPFVIPDILKLVLALALSRRLKRYLK